MQPWYCPYSGPSFIFDGVGQGIDEGYIIDVLSFGELNPRAHVETFRQQATREEIHVFGLVDRGERELVSRVMSTIETVCNGATIHSLDVEHREHALHLTAQIGQIISLELQLKDGKNGRGLRWVMVHQCELGIEQPCHEAFCMTLGLSIHQ